MSSEEESELDSDLEEEEDSEDQSSDYDFLAFLVVREQVSRFLDVIPSTWVLAAYDYDNGDQTTVDYAFPSEEQIGEQIKFRKNKPRDYAWPQFFGDMLFESDSQEEAFKFIKKEMKLEAQLDRILEDRIETEYSGTGKKKETPKPSGTKRKQPADENNPKKSKTSTEPAPAASTSSTVASKPPVATAPKKKAASKA